MSNLTKGLLAIVLLASLIYLACGGGGKDPINPPPGGGKYAGSAACAPCHDAIYDVFIKSGHPFKLNKIEGNKAPAYPYSSVPNPPDGLTWADISYVIGGYGWKARFIGKDGYIITGDANATTQYNLANKQWVAYHPGEQKPYDCGKCHTTGYNATGNQDDIPGLVGTWAEDGVTCEACHGPAANHVADPKTTNVNSGIDPKDSCKNCHIRDDVNIIDASNGFIRHHEQYEELLQSPHTNLDCTACHNPHSGVIYRDMGASPDGGLVKTCEDCHNNITFQASAVMKAAGVECIDCHMPKLVKSAIGDLDTFTGDIATHLFKINVDPDAPQFNPDGTQANDYITLDYACKSCHSENGSASVKTDQALSAKADGYHGDLVGGTNYVGSDRCAECHSGIYDKFKNTGHPFKLNKISGAAPEYPYSSVPDPPSGYTWDDVSYVIGGFKWKARFIDQSGYIITGDSGASTQYNLATQEWVPYHPGETKPYDCGSCHTTGYDDSNPAEHQDGKEGIVGTWNEPGVTCEACHGPGGQHVAAPSPSTINLPGDPGDACANCHIRGDVNIIDASGGFTRHHEQYEELLQSPHSWVGCTGCHDPHLSAVYEDPVDNPDKGMVTQCANCHSEKVEGQKSVAMKAALDCTDCHMPKMVKSAVGDLDMFTADVAAHLFRINTDLAAPQFSPDGSETNGYITIPYACQKCHIEGGSAPAFSLENLASYADGYHEPIDPDAPITSETCSMCHETIYDTFKLSGHPHKLTEVFNGQPPEYPFSSVPNPPSGYSWDDVSYVIGGFGWKARFVGNDGYIITGGPGDKTQYNLATQNWVAYHAGELKPYDCGRCHTTGYSSNGSQNDLPGIVGTWVEEGVGCQACHGPGAEHISNPSPSTINIDGPPEDKCENCHVRGEISIINASGGFIRHHEQSEELLQSPHNGVLKCNSCHNPHQSALYADAILNPNKSLKVQCENCHANEASNFRSQKMDNYGVGCTDCHMPPMVKSAIGDIDTFTGDISTHLFRINTDPNAEPFAPDGLSSNGYITIEYSCQRCHIDGGIATPMSKTGLALYAKDYHAPLADEEYVGSEMCQVCHQSKYDGFMLSGHSYKLNKVENGQPPVYPYSNVPDPPLGYTWDDITYVIGGYAWKARFLGNDGYIITGNTGDTTQYNLATQGWVEYHAGEQKAYDCGPCHTTGYDPAGNQDGLPGIVGTWAQPGVHCEACHGPASQHVQNPSPSTINVNINPNARCADCHTRGDVGVIDAADGFTKHHQQYDELLQSPHGSEFGCTGCHDPHLGAVYEDSENNPDNGLVAYCDDCHPDEAANMGIYSMVIWGITCTDCHMGPMVKSAVGDPTYFYGDVSNHLFKPELDLGNEQFSPDGLETNPYVTVGFLCKYCHSPLGPGSDDSLSSLAGNAVGYHD